MDFVHGQFEAAMKEKKIMETTELSETELDNVVGGGWFSNWWSNNRKTVAINAAIVVGAALVCTGVGAIAGSFITVSAATAATSGATAVAGGFIGGEVSIAAALAAGTTTMAASGAAAGAATGGLMGMIAGGTYAATNLKKE